MLERTTERLRRAGPVLKGFLGLVTVAITSISWGLPVQVHVGSPGKENELSVVLFPARWVSAPKRAKLLPSPKTGLQVIWTDTSTPAPLATRVASFRLTT